MRTRLLILAFTITSLISIQTPVKAEVFSCPILKKNDYTKPVLNSDDKGFLATGEKVNIQIHEMVDNKTWKGKSTSVAPKPNLSYTLESISRPRAEHGTDGLECQYTFTFNIGSGKTDIIESEVELTPKPKSYLDCEPNGEKWNCPDTNKRLEP